MTQPRKPFWPSTAEDKSLIRAAVIAVIATMTIEGLRSAFPAVSALAFAIPVVAIALYLNYRWGRA